MYTIEILTNETQKTIYLEKGTNLLIGLSSNGIFMNSSCGGKGICNKCKVKLIEGNVDVKLEDGYFKSCQYFVKNNIKIQIDDVVGSGLTHFSKIDYEIKQETGYGIAVDIGTTTVVVYLINLENGQIVDKKSELNNQRVYGADVISRINASQNGHLKDLENLIVQQINKIIKSFCTKYNLAKINKVIISGNTTMLHLVKGINPSSIGVYPFESVFLDLQVLDKNTDIYGDKIILLPSASSYIGSDIVAGIVSSKMINEHENNLFVDIGTNGEMVVCNKNKMFACATAAGPAFEGANIEMGVGGIEGAIDHIWYNEGRINYSTLENKKAIGLCGSGIVDLIAVLIDLKMIDETGAFAEENPNKYLFEKLKENKFYTDENIFITQKDIREFQLAKSAIVSGMLSLVDEADLKLNEIDNIYLAGGFGFYLNLQSAIKIGLFPIEFAGKIKNVGNTSGQGAIMCLSNDKYINECCENAKKIEIVELANNSKFMDNFIENMSF